MPRRFSPSVLLIFAAMSMAVEVSAQGPSKPTRKKPRPPFKWVNPPTLKLPGVKHGVFESPSMGLDVGYCIYLPPGYEDDAKRRYPVVYYLHGGRPGSESKSVRLASFIHQYITESGVPPLIYVFVNGGPVSHYNLPERENAMGEDIFVNELIPHIDKTYRSIADRKGRAVEGFSQGGRGTTRIMLKHPHLFCSAAPGGAGYATEKRISEDNGRENENLVFAPGYNTWDLARNFAQRRRPPLRIMIHVGTKGFNYENNLEYMKFLESLEIPFARLIVDGVPHSAQQIYEKRGLELVKFHVESFRRSGALAEFVPLFDGKSFTGWQHNGNWVIEDGAFYRKAKGGPLTYTAQTVPDDFELRFDWKVSKGCNSGIYYRPGQVEYQILDNVDSPYGENARQSAASLFFCMAPRKDATRPVGQWNTGRVVCQGTVIEHWLNGERVISFDYTDSKWSQYVKLLGIRGGNLTGRGGRLWLQDHGQDVWFRNLRWRRIPADEKITPDADFEPLPVTGKALEKEQARVEKMLKAKAKN